MPWAAGFGATMILVTGCGGAQGGSCGAGRTLVDGVCVREDVADYVACVRSQGARLDQRSATRLTADAEYLVAQGKVTSDVSDSLLRTYATSDENIREIIRACRDLTAAPPPAATPGDPTSTAHGAIATSADGKVAGLSWQMPSREAAAARAVEFCGGATCAFRHGYRDACAALVKAGTGAFYWGAGQPDATSSRVVALGACIDGERKAGRTPSCALDVSGCSGTAFVADPPARHGSIAMRGDGRWAGLANVEPSAEAADRVALAACGDPSCTVARRYADACGALAETPEGWVYWAGGQADLQAARTAVLATCEVKEREQGRVPSCSIPVSGCSGAAR